MECPGGCPGENNCGCNCDWCRNTTCKGLNGDWDLDKPQFYKQKKRTLYRDEEYDEDENGY